jgi:hypothetical protein
MQTHAPAWIRCADKRATAKTSLKPATADASDLDDQEGRESGLRQPPCAQDRVSKTLWIGARL